MVVIFVFVGVLLIDLVVANCGAKNGYVLVSELRVCYVCMRACRNCVIENTVVLMFFGSYFIH